MNTKKMEDGDIREENEIACYVRMAQKYADLSYQDVYMMDLRSNKFIYMSDRALNRYGITKAALVDERWDDFFARFVTESDVAMVTKAFETILTQTTALPTTRFEEFVIYLTLNMKKSYPMMSETHKIALFDVNHSGEPRLLLGLIVPAVYPHAVVALANIVGTDSHYWYDIDAAKWEKVSPLKLTPEEILMLRLSMQGYSHEQMAQIMNKTSHTIKYYRRRIFDKLGVTNIAQAISVAISACII